MSRWQFNDDGSKINQTNKKPVSHVQHHENLTSLSVINTSL
jgi:hypothetical protein